MLNNIKIGTKLIGSFLLLALGLAFVAYLGYTNMKTINDGMTTMYKDRLMPVLHLEDAESASLKVRGDVYKFMTFPEDRAQLKLDIAASIEKVNENWALYAQTLIDPREVTDKQAFEKVWPLYQQAVNEIIRDMETGNEEDALASLKDGDVYTTREEVNARLHALILTNVAIADEVNKAGDVTFQNTSNVMLITGIVGVVAALGIGVFLSRSITVPLTKAVTMIQEMNVGHLGDRLRLSRRDEIGVMAQTMDSFAESLQVEVVGAIQKIAAGDLSVIVKPRDSRDEIGPALQQMLDTLQALIAEANMLTRAAVEGRLATRGNASKFKGGYHDIVAGVNDTLDAVIGPLNVAAEYIDRISKGDIPAKITDTYQGDFNEIKLNLNQCIAAVNALVADANALSAAAVAGKLATRADATRHQGDFRKIVQGVNDTLDAVIGPLNISAEYLDRISKGDIPTLITDAYQGDFNEIKNNLNMLITTLNEFIAEMSRMSREQNAGDLDARIAVDRFSGAYRQMAQGVVDQVFEHIRVKRAIVTVVGRYGEGDFTAVMERLPGKKAFIHEQLDIVRGNLQNLANTVNGLSQAAVAGKLSTRADASSFRGDWAKLVQGMNDTLDAVIGPLNVAAAYVDRISKGDIPAKITDNYNGDFNTIKNNLNICIDAVNALVADANMLSAAAVAGRLATRADASRHQGDFRKIVQGVDDTLDAVIGPLNVAATYVDRISKGDIPTKITDSYNGDFNTIKNNLNTCIDAVNALIADANMLSAAAVAGRLATRADTSRHQGDFRKIVVGVNDTLDAVIGPLNVAADYVNQIAKGEIPDSITTQYAGDFGVLRDNLNILSARLREMIGSLQEAANNLASASAQILAATTQQASGASEQSASITQTTTTVDEVKTISDQAIMRAQEVSDAARRTIEVSRSGRDAVASTIESMTAIKGRVEGIAENILALSDQTQQIGEITTTVSDIAAQSNMLALNASVEAARAGEHGKGFAVVAMEVRNLAEQSKQATAQVRAILTDIQNAINASVMVTEEGTKVVDDGVRRAAQAREAIEQLSAVIAESAQVSAQVVAGGQQQASGVEQIALAIQNIHQAMQQSLASTRQAETAARNLNSLAMTLTDTVKQYKVNGNGRR